MPRQYSVFLGNAGGCSDRYCSSYANELNCSNLGIVLDYGHAFLGGENPSESLVLLKRYGGRLMHIHMNDNYRSWDDDMIAGSVHTIELIEFLYWLRRTAYKGWITLDQFPYRQDGRDALAATRMARGLLIGNS